MDNSDPHKLTIFDFLRNPNLSPSTPRLEEGGVDGATNGGSRDANSCFKELIENDKYFHRHVTENFRGLPGLDQIPIVEINVEQPIVKCYSISDLHADDELTMKWVEEKCKPALIDAGSVFNVLIVSGGVSSQTTKIAQLFHTLARSFDAISFIPGNHDLLLSLDPLQRQDCVQKLKEIYAALRGNAKVHCGPVKLRYGEDEERRRELLLLPMHAWCHASWDRERDIENAAYAEVQRFPFTAFHTRWLDFTRCRWPAAVVDQDALVCRFGEEIPPHNAALAEAFAAQNECFLRSPPHKLLSENDPAAMRFFGCKYTQSSTDENAVHAGAVTVISFSHFLPRQELLPEKRFLFEPMFAKVAGSDVLESQVRRLQPHLHLCGHGQLPIDLTLQGIRYVQWPLGNAQERALQCKPVADAGPLCVFDSQLGDGHAGVPRQLASLATPWSKYYADPTARQADVVEPLAPWLQERIEAMRKIASR